MFGLILKTGFLCNNEEKKFRQIFLSVCVNDGVNINNVWKEKIFEIYYLEKCENKNVCLDDK